MLPDGRECRSALLRCSRSLYFVPLRPFPASKYLVFEASRTNAKVAPELESAGTSPCPAPHRDTRAGWRTVRRSASGSVVAAGPEYDAPEWSLEGLVGEHSYVTTGEPPRDSP